MSKRGRGGGKPKPLPSRATDALLSWLLEHAECPYPSQEERVSSNESCVEGSVLVFIQRCDTVTSSPSALLMALSGGTGQKLAAHEEASHHLVCQCATSCSRHPQGRFLASQPKCFWTDVLGKAYGLKTTFTHTLLSIIDLD